MHRLGERLEDAAGHRIGLPVVFRVPLHTDREALRVDHAHRLDLTVRSNPLGHQARGELVELDALVSALKANRLLAYATDVLDHEPPPADHPLLGLPNVIVTPHIGSRTHESVQRQASCAVENLTRFFSGMPPIAQANPEVGNAP